MYKQTLYKILPNHVKSKILKRNNRYKKWEYGYNEDHDFVVISRTGMIGEVYEIQGLKIALPKQPKNIHKFESERWEKTLLPKVLGNIKSVFEWDKYPEDFKERWYDYIDEEFNRREQGLMHLDRDDTGLSFDTISTSFGLVEYKENREMVTIRGYVPGEYVVNVHMYTKREDKETPVTIILEKINPYKVVTGRNVVLKLRGDEKTAFRFTVDDEGKVIQTNQLEKGLAKRNPRPTLPGDSS